MTDDTDTTENDASDDGDDLFEISETVRLSREDAAKRLHEIADSLARHNSLEFDRDGLKFTVDVPKEVELEIELEVGEDGTELEIEIRW